MPSYKPLNPDYWIWIPFPNRCWPRIPIDNTAGSGPGSLLNAFKKAAESWLMDLDFFLNQNLLRIPIQYIDLNALTLLLRGWFYPHLWGVRGGGVSNQSTLFKLVTEKVNFLGTFFCFFKYSQMSEFTCMCLRAWSPLDHALRHPWKLLVWALKKGGYNQPHPPPPPAELGLRKIRTRSPDHQYTSDPQPCLSVWHYWKLTY